MDAIVAADAGLEVEATPGLCIASSFAALEAAQLKGVPVLVCVQIAAHVAGLGLVAAGFVADPLELLDSVSLTAEDLPPVALESGAAVFSRADVVTLFRAPPGVAVRFGFVAVLPGAAADARASALVRLRSGEVERQLLPATGDQGELADLVARAPQDYALAVIAYLSAAAGAPVKLIDRMAQFVFERIDPGFDYGHGRGRLAVACHVDMAIRAGDRGILLKGWLLSDALDGIACIDAVSVAGARAAMRLPLPKLGRPDVLESRAAEGMKADRHCGFVAFADLPGLAETDRRWFLEIRMDGGAVHRIPFPCGPCMAPLPAIQAVVALAESSAVSFNDLFDRAIAPALDWFWAKLQAGRPAPVVRDFGMPPAGAAVSIVVPLYGRMDFVRHQIASFSNDPDFRAAAGVAELIYVLDDPAAETDLLMLCRLLYDIYGMPFRLVLQKGNFGYSAANNAGAKVATGRRLLLLNSDVMPKQVRWVSTLARLYDGLEDCGVLGCRLLFEDGSIQHAGMNFRPSLFFSQAWTNEHGFKGLSTAFDPQKETQAVAAVTGACLMIDRALFAFVGGMTSDYVIGDFEDSDLCLKVHRRGLKVYYTPAVELYHLERQSMKRIGHGHEGWRQSLTLFNMWKHSRRWEAMIPAIMAQYDPDGVRTAPRTFLYEAEPEAVQAPSPKAAEPARAAPPEGGRPALADFDRIGTGREQMLLGAACLPARSHFTVFPAGAERLVPFEPEGFDIGIPRFSLFDFDDVTVHGFRLFECGGALFNDYSLVDRTGTASADFWKKYHDGQTEALVLDAAARPTAAAAPIEIDGAGCVILSGDEPYNFGSWIYRYLAKFALARAARPFDRVFAYDDQRWMLPVLQLVDPAVTILPQDPARAYRIRNATIASLPAPHVFFRPEIIDCFADIVARIGPVPGLPERIYVSRRKHAMANPGMRVLENETELVERLAGFGFGEFFPEDYPLAVQIAVFAQARLIVSPGGSNLFCAAFARDAEFILDIESGDDWSYAHMNLLASTRRPHSVVRGVRTGRGEAVHGNWVMDVEAVIEGLQALAILGKK